MNWSNPNVLLAAIVGAVLVLIGIWGFFTEPVLIVFGINVLHNLVHLVTGAVLLAAVFIANGVYTRATNLTLGVVYAIVAVLGFAGILVPELLNQDASTVANADNWLHTLLAIVLIAVPLVVRTPHERETRIGRTV